MENQRATLQTTMERIKRPIGQPKLQPHMTLQTLGGCIKQESEEGTTNQESKKHQRGTYTQWFALHLWPHIQVAMDRHKSWTITYIISMHFIENQGNIQAHLINSLDIIQENGLPQIQSSNQRVKKAIEWEESFYNHKITHSNIKSKARSET